MKGGTLTDNHRCPGHPLQLHFIASAFLDVFSRAYLKRYFALQVLNDRKTKVSGQLHAPAALSMVREHWCPLDRRTVKPRFVCCDKRKKKHWPCQELNSGRSARCYHWGIRLTHNMLEMKKWNQGKMPLGRPKRRRMNNSKLNLKLLKSLSVFRLS